MNPAWSTVERIGKYESKLFACIEESYMKRGLFVEGYLPYDRILKARSEVENVFSTDELSIRSRNKVGTSELWTGEDPGHIRSMNDVVMNNLKVMLALDQIKIIDEYSEKLQQHMTAFGQVEAAVDSVDDSDLDYDDDGGESD